MRLEYVRARGTEACPQEPFFRNVVAGHLGGRDPFASASPPAEKRVVLTLRRTPRGYGAQFVLFNAAGKRLGSSTEVFDTSCTEVVESAGAVIVPWLLPVSLPAAPVSPPPVAAATPVDRPPAEPHRAPEPEEASASPSPPAEAPKPSVFEGNTGVARAVLYAIAAAGLATGTGFAIASNSAANHASSLQATLVQSMGTMTCSKPTSGVTGNCQQLSSLWARRDKLAEASEGFFIAAGALGVATTISIWIPAAKEAPIDVKPTAQGAPAGLTLAGVW